MIHQIKGCSDKKHTCGAFLDEDRTLIVEWQYRPDAIALSDGKWIAGMPMFEPLWGRGVPDFDVYRALVAPQIAEWMTEHNYGHDLHGLVRYWEANSRMALVLAEVPDLDEYLKRESEGEDIIQEIYAKVLGPKDTAIIESLRRTLPAGVEIMSMDDMIDRLAGPDLGPGTRGFIKS